MDAKELYSKLSEARKVNIDFNKEFKNRLSEEIFELINQVSEYSKELSILKVKKNTCSMITDVNFAKALSVDLFEIESKISNLENERNQTEIKTRYKLSLLDAAELHLE